MFDILVTSCCFYIPEEHCIYVSYFLKYSIWAEICSELNSLGLFGMEEYKIEEWGKTQERNRNDGSKQRFGKCRKRLGSGVWNTGIFKTEIIKKLLVAPNKRYTNNGVDCALESIFYIQGGFYSWAPWSMNSVQLQSIILICSLVHHYG